MGFADAAVSLMHYTNTPPNTNTEYQLTNIPASEPRFAFRSIQGFSRIFCHARQRMILHQSSLRRLNTRRQRYGKAHPPNGKYFKILQTLLVLSMCQDTLSAVKSNTPQACVHSVCTVHLQCQKYSCKMEMEHSSASVTEWIPRGGRGGGQSEHSRQAFPAVVL